MGRLKRYVKIVIRKSMEAEKNKTERGAVPGNNLFQWYCLYSRYGIPKWLNTQVGKVIWKYQVLSDIRWLALFALQRASNILV